ncbi:hypothetical protein EV421DRAFT_1711006 [Armillaria borealis]|uniref:Uncharacterized protein n=1 Tax=Armillaria borealis TaxID=47425 RepID=A0AA39JHI4_9AGAR|nr:hypothetical protein EV421DRAFT_1711006 [Armillaria borealis]
MISIEDSTSTIIGVIICDVIRNIPHINNIIAQVQAIMPGVLEYDHSRRPGYKYTAFHGQIYNRFSQVGKDAPTGVHPHMLYIEGWKNNPTQRLPHYSRQVNKDPDRFELLHNTFKPLIGAIREKLKQVLPKEYKLLEGFTDHLMMNEDSAAHLFGGFVLNFRACMSMHRDTGDYLICIIIPFGEFEGGKLCLFKPGLVLRLLSWDAFIFRSVDITHFNLHYSGVRASLVLHTDREAADFAKDYNGWIEHIAT